MNIFLFISNFCIAAVLTYYFAYQSSFLVILDTPNARSLHQKPTPKMGGTAIVIALLLTFPFTQIGQVDSLFWLLSGGLLIVAISFLDDCVDLAASKRFLVHLMAAAFVVWQAELAISSLELPALSLALPYWLSFGLAWLFIGWMTNLYNFMDGMDGFAGGMSVLGFATLALFGYLANAPEFMWLNLLIVAATSGFLLFNFPPAKIFMGDVGSTSLGFLAAGLGLWGQQHNIVPLWITILIFSPFIVDASVTLTRRLLQGEKVWQAHRSHYYQRLVTLGWGHKHTVLAEYGLMLACSGSAVWAYYLPPTAQWGVLSGWLLIYGLLMLGVQWLEQDKTTIPALSLGKNEVHLR